MLQSDAGNNRTGVDDAETSLFLGQGKMIPGTPSAQQSLSQALLEPTMPSSSVKRRGRPRGWTDSRIALMLTFLERHFTEFQTGSYINFYANLATHLGDEVDHAEVREKLEKMVKKYETDKRRGDYGWKWFRRMNEIFKGPSVPDDLLLSDGDSETEFEDEIFGKKTRIDGLPVTEITSFGELQAHYAKMRARFQRVKHKSEHRMREMEKQLHKLQDQIDMMRSQAVEFFDRIEKEFDLADSVLKEKTTLTAETDLGNDDLALN